MYESNNKFDNFYVDSTDKSRKDLIVLEEEIFAMTG